MSNPMQNDPPRRRSDGEKLTDLLDLLGIVVKALLRIFGKRQTDTQE